ncbi:MAG: MFS transporter, partial [Acidobacteriota bacterium]|nr:MFS transporter [Acidobacteriota bacterium]
MTRWRALGLLAAAELAGMSVWFGASAAAPALAAQWGFGVADAGRLTLAVQLGFVLGTLVSAVANLSDVFRARHVFAVSALLAAIANAAFALFSAGPEAGLSLRFATGFFLAGVYPPGLKMMASWFREGRGLALGVLIGALTLGKASPYLVNAVGSADWRVNLIALSFLAVAGGAIALFVGDGPFATGTAPFDFRQVAYVFRNRGVRLASYGYFGHMWELYAMWTWAPVMIRASLERTGSPRGLAEAASFLVIGSGAVGCVAAGLLADRYGRTWVASAAMAVSGACCLAVGFLFGGSAAALLAIAVVWGASVVADSAQFSACVTELADPRYVGTALTLQICLGFLLTTASIALVGRLSETVGWRWAFAALAPGP